MAFDFEVVVTGVCGFIPNDADLDKVTKACVVIPNGTQAHATPIYGAIDGQQLERHVGFIRTAMRSCAAVRGPLPRELEGLMYLDRHRVTFEMKGIEYPGERLVFPRLDDAEVESPEDPMPPGHERSFSW